jgi:hypothetical protein
MENRTFRAEFDLRDGSEEPDGEFSRTIELDGHRLPRRRAVLDTNHCDVRPTNDSGKNGEAVDRHFQGLPPGRSSLFAKAV